MTTGHHQTARPAARSMRGFALLEGLFAILIFSFGVLAVMGLQINSIAGVRDAKFRSDAALLADQIIGQMWADRGNLASYALNADATSCSAGTNASANANVSDWLADMAAVLPQTASIVQQISVDASNIVTVTVCWRHPQDGSAASHRFSATAQIRG